MPKFIPWNNRKRMLKFVEGMSSATPEQVEERNKAIAENFFAGLERERKLVLEDKEKNLLHNLFYGKRRSKEFIEEYIKTVGSKERALNVISVLRNKIKETVAAVEKHESADISHHVRNAFNYPHLQLEIAQKKLSELTGKN